MKARNSVIATSLGLLLVACGGDGQGHSTAGSGGDSNATGTAGVGMLEFEGEQFELTWSSCANRPERDYLRWLADADGLAFQFQRYEPRSDEEAHRYTMRLTRRGRDTWENVFRDKPEITITEQAVEGRGMVYPRDTPYREIEQAMRPVTFEFRCR